MFFDGRRSRENASVLFSLFQGGTVNHPIFAFFQPIDAKYQNLRPLLFLVVLMMSLSLLPMAYAGTGKQIPNNTPPYASSAASLGLEDSSKIIDIAIWLQPHNRSLLDEFAQDLYDAASPNYRHWLKHSDIVKNFAPTAEEMHTVQDFLESKNLKVVRVGPDNFYVRARGAIADVENAFHVELVDYQVGNQTLRSNAGDPYVEGPAAALVQVVSGLDNGGFRYPFQARPARLSALSGPHSDRDLSNAVGAADSSAFESVCFPGPKTEHYTTGGGYPQATYTGNVYNESSSGCGYVPADLYTAYDLSGLYLEGYDGTGQTIVILDACGSPTIRDDANTFSKKFGLPKLTASNFSVLEYPSPSTCEGLWPNINMDIEWAHAIAPGANIINLIVPEQMPDFEDTDEAEYYAVTSGLGNVISGGFYTPEAFASAAELNKENLISELAAVSGIATNFASGDYANWGFIPGGPWISAPADLPYATGVGGVSLALNSDDSILFQTGWENHLSIMIEDGVISDPPYPPDFGDYFSGSTGGASRVFAKPSFQKGVPGKYRQEPDISWLGDPFTGALIVVTQPEQYPPQVWYAAAGTELSTAMFSALWSIANQEAGTALGQAAPYLYTMTSTTITDIVPYSSADDIKAVVEESPSAVQHFNALQTMGLVPSLPFGKFYSAIADDPSGEVFGISFGGDYHLRVKVGWDEVTGLGTPNAKAFADSFSPGSKK
jgi:subtilase family serine protease